MKVAVSNSGPLIHLGAIDQLDLLFYLFDMILIPRSVYFEVVENGIKRGYSDSFIVKKQIEKGLITIKEVKSHRLNDTVTQGLHKGEIEAIELTARIGKGVILLDDEAARLLALSLNLKVKSTIGIVIDCVRLGHISQKMGKEFVKKLNNYMYLSGDIISMTFEAIDLQK